MKAEEVAVEEAVVAEVVGDEDAAIVITTAKAVVKIAGVTPEVAIAKLGKTTAVKVAIELIETTAAACHLC